MADLTITAASVLKGTGAVTTRGTAGTSITAGQVVYADSSDGGKYKLADCTTSAATAAAVGIALHAAADEQPLQILTSGPITIGATVVAGTSYILSTSGGICPDADKTTSDRVVRLGYASSASVLQIYIQNTGVTL